MKKISMLVFLALSSCNEPKTETKKYDPAKLKFKAYDARIIGVIHDQIKEETLPGPLSKIDYAKPDNTNWVLENDKFFISGLQNFALSNKSLLKIQSIIKSNLESKGYKLAEFKKQAAVYVVVTSKQYHQHDNFLNGERFGTNSYLEGTAVGSRINIKFYSMKCGAHPKPLINASGETIYHDQENSEAALIKEVKSSLPGLILPFKQDEKKCDKNQFPGCYYQLGLKKFDDRLIYDLHAESSAWKAGIRPGDLFISKKIAVDKGQYNKLSRDQKITAPQEVLIFSNQEKRIFSKKLKPKLICL